ncbi:olfactory receptor 8S1-like [Dipodomys merriami]|uniref:olfactory receptor 8S1-like n=1 Tax=Dipodomys merriami TaxID=94247 RepID=UPI00384C33B8
MAWKNRSSITEFIFTGLSDDPHIEALLFVLFLAIYLLTMMGNLMLLVVIKADTHLHTPMYFFLSNLSFIDLCFSSVTLPKLLEDFLSDKKTISVEGCLTQVFFVFFSSGTEACLLSVMAYDRYAAICHPLHYGQYSAVTPMLNPLIYSLKNKEVKAAVNRTNCNQGNCNEVFLLLKPPSNLLTMETQSSVGE